MATTMAMRNSAERTFALEHELVDSFAQIAPTFLSSGEHTHCGREVELGGKLADLVAWSFPSSEREELEALRRAGLTDLGFLAHLLERPLSAATLAKRTHYPLDHTERRLRALCKYGLLFRSGQAYQPTGWERHLPGEVLAFEAKLMDWRTALLQAVYYARFADTAWVLMPEERGRQAAEMRAACIAAGVGLILFNGLRLSKPVRPRKGLGSPYHRRLFRLRLAWSAS